MPHWTDRLPFALPRPHFMGLASLDVWARVLLSPPAWVPPRYWLRLAGALFTSALATLLVLPERVLLAPVLLWRGRRSGWTLPHKPGVVVILGYFRSGTTHLHYLLSCDPRFRTPAWCETLAPHGFAASWWFLRWFLVPFLSNTRPQDDVALGPEWPAEDDFALCNGAAASCLIGRMVVPGRHEHYKRFHSLSGLSVGERSRWRRMLWGFLWKQAVLSRGRPLLLKSPSHTARVAELIDLFGAQNVRFVHIRRDAGAVVRSNVAMDRRMEPQLLRAPPPEAEIERRVRVELAVTNAAFARDQAEIPAGGLCEITFDELVADPMKAARRIYADLGMELSAAAEQRMGAYLGSVREYRPASGSPMAVNVPLQVRRIPPQAWLGMGLTAIAAVPLWIGAAWLIHDRSDWLVWPVGTVIGIVAVRTAGRGSTSLGLVAAATTLAVLLAVAWPATYLAEYYRVNPHSFHEQWPHIWLSTHRGLIATNNVFWGFMGLISAYRFASRRHMRPPGR